MVWQFHCCSKLQKCVAKNTLLEKYMPRTRTPLSLTQECLIFLVIDPHSATICLDEKKKVYVGQDHRISLDTIIPPPLPSAKRVLSQDMNIFHYLLVYRLHYAHLISPSPSTLYKYIKTNNAGQLNVFFSSSLLRGF